MRIIKPSLGVSQLFMRDLSHQLANYERWAPSDPRRLSSIRASGLPFCAVGFLTHIGHHGLNSKLDSGGLYFTSVGTTVHTWIQDMMGPTQAVLGNWKHKKTKEYRAWSVHPDPEDLDWEYDELRIEFLTLVGHIDCVFVLDKDLAVKASRGKTEEIRRRRFKSRKIGLSVLDYKTCSTAGLPGKLRDQGLSYTLQAQAYAAALHSEGMAVKSYGNVFIPRDNPFRSQIVTHPWTPAANRAVRKAIRENRDAHKLALEARTWKDFKALIGDKCGNIYCEACKSKDPGAGLRDAYKRGKAKGRWPVRKLLDNK